MLHTTLCYVHLKLMLVTSYWLHMTNKLNIYLRIYLTLMQDGIVGTRLKPQIFITLFTHIELLFESI